MDFVGLLFRWQYSSTFIGAIMKEMIAANDSVFYADRPRKREKLAHSPPAFVFDFLLPKRGSKHSSILRTNSKSFL